MDKKITELFLPATHTQNWKPFIIYLFYWSNLKVKMRDWLSKLYIFTLQNSEVIQNSDVGMHLSYR